MAYEIKVDKSKCIGCGACEATCDNFEVVDGKARPKKPKVNDIGCNQQAADACPVSAITVKKV